MIILNISFMLCIGLFVFYYKKRIIEVFVYNYALCIISFTLVNFTAAANYYNIEQEKNDKTSDIFSLFQYLISESVGTLVWSLFWSPFLIVIPSSALLISVVINKIVWNKRIIPDFHHWEFSFSKLNPFSFGDKALNKNYIFLAYLLASPIVLYFGSILDNLLAYWSNYEQDDSWEIWFLNYLTYWFESVYIGLTLMLTYIVLIFVGFIYYVIKRRHE